MLTSMKNLAVLILLTVVLCSCDRVSSKYTTLKDAREARLFERGWLPNILPPSAHSIVVNNDLDVNTSYGQFDFTPPDFPAFAKQLNKELSDAQQKFTFQRDDHTWIFTCDSEKGRCKYELS